MSAKITKEIEEKLIRLYTTTEMTYEQLAQECNIGTSSISNILKRNNIKANHQKYNASCKTKGIGRILTLEQEKEVIKLYKTKKFPQKLLAERFNCSTYVISNILKRNNIEKINHFNPINKDLNETYFSQIDNEYKAYFLGFLFGDGCVDKNGVGIEINERDIDLLYTFKEQLNSIRKISSRKRPSGNMVSTAVNSKQIISDLAIYGIIPNKTKMTKHLPYKKIPIELLPHFIRGLIDSDGWISFTKEGRAKIGFVTNYREVAEEFKDACNLILSNENQIKSNITNKGDNSGWVCQIQSQKVARELATLVYKDNQVCLTRKYDRAKNIYEYKEDNDIV